MRVIRNNGPAVAMAASFALLSLIAVPSARAQCVFAPGANDYQVRHDLVLTMTSAVAAFDVAGTWDHSFSVQAESPSCFEDATPGGSLVLGGGPITRSSSSSECTGKVSANTNSAWNLGITPTGLSGSMCSFGNANTVIGKSSARASSFTGIFATGIHASARGHLRWALASRWSMLAGDSDPRTLVDPVAITVADSATQDILLDETLLSVEISFPDTSPNTKKGYFCSDSVGECAGTTVLDAPNADFTITMHPTLIPAAAQRGNLALSVRNGQVVSSSDDGIFNGVLPPNGASVPITLNRTFVFDFDYNLGTFSGHPNIDVDFRMEGSGETSETKASGVAVPDVMPGRAGLLALILIITGACVLGSRRNRAAA